MPKNILLKKDLDDGSYSEWYIDGEYIGKDEQLTAEGILEAAGIDYEIEWKEYDA